MAHCLLPRLRSGQTTLSEHLPLNRRDDLSQAAATGSGRYKHFDPRWRRLHSVKSQKELSQTLRGVGARDGEFDAGFKGGFPFLVTQEVINGHRAAVHRKAGGMDPN